MARRQRNRAARLKHIAPPQSARGSAAVAASPLRDAGPTR